LQPTELTLHVISQAEAGGQPNYGSTHLPLNIQTEMMSVLPEGGVWDGWLETESPAPADAVGAVLVFRFFEFEDPYDESGATQAEWDSTQEGQSVWYQVLR
jgi:hypothetical protein